MAQSTNEVEGSIAAGAASNSSAAASPSTDEIRAQIAQTRVELSGTIDAIQQRLSPSRVIADARASIAEATLSGASRVARGTADSAASVLKTIRQNPVPVTIFGAAAGLIVQAVRMRRHSITSLTRRDPWLPDRASDSTGSGFVVAAAAGIACWAMWRTQRRRYDAVSERSDD